MARTADLTYPDAARRADPAAVRAARTPRDAGALFDEFATLADGLVAVDADATDVGDAMDLAGDQAAVADAARAAQRAERQVRDAREHLTRAVERLAQARGPERADAQAQVKAAEAEAAWAERQLRRASDRLDERIDVAEDAAFRLRAGLTTRHGGIGEAAQAARAQMAASGFYEDSAPVGRRATAREAEGAQIGRPATAREREDTKIGEPMRGTV